MENSTCNDYSMFLTLKLFVSQFLYTLLLDTFFDLYKSILVFLWTSRFYELLNNVFSLFWSVYD